MNKLPKNLIYNPYNTDIYRMFNTRNGENIGEMIAIPSAIHRTLIIHRLIIPRSVNRRQGAGTDFLNFAKKMSKSLGYKGRMLLLASALELDPHNPPHIFYRKFGFTTDNKDLLKKIDKCIKKGTQLDYKKTPQTFMHYPDEEKPKQTFWQKLKKIWK